MLDAPDDSAIPGSPLGTTSAGADFCDGADGVQLTEAAVSATADGVAAGTTGAGAGTSNAGAAQCPSNGAHARVQPATGARPPRPSRESSDDDVDDAAAACRMPDTDVEQPAPTPLPALLPHRHGAADRGDDG